MKAVCYYRHSTDNRKQDENSIERQQHSCRRLCLGNGWEILEEVSDKGESGTSDKQNLEALKQRVKGGFRFDVLVVDDQARLTRKDVLSMGEDIGFLRDAGIKISIVATQNGNPLQVEELARDVTHLVKGWANHEEVRDTARKVCNGMLELFKSGRLGHMGPTPLGFDKIRPWDQTKSKDEQEPSFLRENSDLQVARELFLHVLNGGTIRSGVAILETAAKYQKFDGKKQKFPCCTSVKHILRNAIYCGVETFGVRDAGKWETASGRKASSYVNENPLTRAVATRESKVKKAVSYNEFCRVQDILDQNKKKKPARPAIANHRYSSLLKCGNCDGMMIAHRRTNKNGSSIVDYKCSHSTSSGTRCRQHVKPWAKSVNEKELDEMFSQFFGGCNLDYGFHGVVITKIVDEINSISITKSETSLKDELARLDIEERKVRQAYEKFTDIPDWIVDKQAEITSERKSLQEKMKEPMLLSEAAKLEYELSLKSETPRRRKYLAGCWAIAQEIIQGNLDPNDTQQCGNAIRKLIEDSFLVDGEQFYGWASETGELVGFTYPDPNDVLSGLRQMGLDEVTVNWGLSEKRGKPKQSMAQLAFQFVGYSDHTLTDWPQQSA
jgi:DNA invertase Pin-like site-specific DNA recombinase